MAADPRMLASQAATATLFASLERSAADANDPSILPALDFARSLAAHGDSDFAVALLIIAVAPPALRPAAAMASISAVQTLMRVVCGDDDK